MTVLVGNHSAGAVGVIVVVQWFPDDAGAGGAVGDECVIEQGALVGNVRRSLVLPTEYGPLTDSRPNVGCSIELPCAGHFFELFMYTDAAPANPQIVNVAVELGVSGAERSAAL